MAAPPLLLLDDDVIDAEFTEDDESPTQDRPPLPRHDVHAALGADDGSRADRARRMGRLTGRLCRRRGVHRPLRRCRVRPLERRPRRPRTGLRRPVPAARRRAPRPHRARSRRRRSCCAAPSSGRSGPPTTSPSRPCRLPTSPPSTMSSTTSGRSSCPTPTASRDRVAAAAWDVCRFDEFWVDVIDQLGFEGDAGRLANGHVSALSRSIHGLSTVGMMLALVERGGRHDRLQSGRLRPGRSPRSLRRDTRRTARATPA